MAETVDLGSLKATLGLNLQDLRRDVGAARSQIRSFSGEMVGLAEQAGNSMGTRLGQGLVKGIQESARQMAAGVRGAVRQAEAAVFGMTHDKADANRLKAHLRYEDDTALGVPQETAIRRRDLSLQNIAEAERREQQRLQDARAKLGMTRFQREALEAQRDFDSTFRSSENPATRGEAALLYQARVLDIQRRRNTASMREVAPGMDRFSNALSGDFSFMDALRERGEAEAQENEKRMRDMERLRAFEFRTGRLSLEEYRAFLQERLQALQEASPEWQKTYERLYKLDNEAMKREFRGQGVLGADSMAQGIDQGSSSVKNALMTLSSESLSVLSRSLRKGVTGVFGDIVVRTLTNLLSESLESALASAFRKKPQAQASGFVGGLFGSVFDIMGGMFGFDDAANDRTAQTWGWDFAKHFRRGADSFQAQRSGGISAPVSASPIYQTTVNVHYTGQGNAADYGEMGRRIALEVQRELRRSL